VLTVDGADYGLHKWIYGNTRVLWRTDQLLARQSHIDFPDAYRNWIEPVYDASEWPDEPPTVTRGHDQWWGAQIAATMHAKSMISTPRRLFNDDDVHITIKTRDGEMSLSILPLRDDGRLLDGASLNEMEDRAQLEALALNVVPVPNSWQGRLRDVKPDDEGRFHVLMKQDGLAHSVRLPSGTLLRYTAEFGLERESDEPA
jgi:CRISPR-associated endonuclease/helicase Cas3